jgi:hypothetical protein
VAYTQFILAHGSGRVDAFQEWMRIIRNLVVNTAYNRPDDFRRSVQGVMVMLEHTSDILTHMAQSERPVTGFNELQLEEEKVKAQLILADDGWRPLLDRAEAHGYFRGQVGFLLEFAGVTAKCTDSAPESWSSSDHADYQDAFLRDLELAETMFSAQGLLDPGKYLWQRALLTLGDYLLPSGRNRSFVVNATTEEASWKRLLSGAGARAKRSRALLKTLFSKLSPGVDLADQLNSVIEGDKALEVWRQEAAHCPAVLDYCERKMIRIDERGHIYLLKRSQMNGAHAELFTFCLYKQLSAGGIKLSSLRADYQSVNDTYSEPHISLSSDQLNVLLTIEIGLGENEYLVYLPIPDDVALAGIFLKSQFEEVEGRYQRTVDRALIVDFLQELDTEIEAHPRGVA